MMPRSVSRARKAWRASSVLRDPNWYTGICFCSAATRNGSAALRHDTGQLVPGHKADVILVDTANPMFTPLMPGDKAHIYSHLVFSANGSAVDTTIVDGQVLMRGRELLTMDEPQILSGASEGFLRTLEKIRS